MGIDGYWLLIRFSQDCSANPHYSARQIGVDAQKLNCFRTQAPVGQQNSG